MLDLLLLVLLLDKSLFPPLAQGGLMEDLPLPLILRTLLLPVLLRFNSSTAEIRSSLGSYKERNKNREGGEMNIE